ncbi:DNA internalization-related competence protein ComEC/Rec2 [Anaerosphaera multitolerans]|uniref:DNA internalization-related competence protein ComEC/Rec2 n=1 Tax=Anaerosphaera multitolerans TaxID=2487351 RepID=A0A437S8C6_9FIRM|nr:DNA internalization-related competence protein ComEC/Rec2 [Anaerosphaera multitolerans]RVU55345.1 DNA internalization-related competence protein ComEC/Rec2 [Anaerosphaera multitolerans]
MVKLLISVLLGILTALSFRLNSYIVIFLILFSILGLIFLSEDSKDRLLFLCIILFFLSSLNVNYREKYELNSNLVRGTVLKRDMGNSQKYTLKVKGGKGKVQFYTKEDLNIGEEIIIKGDIKLPQPRMNFGGFDYKNYLKSKGINFIIYAKNIERIKKPNLYFKLQKLFIEYVENTFDNSMTEKNSSFIKSIVLVNSGYLEDSTKENFKNIGISHILALSGLHITIITYFCEFILKIFNISKLKQKIISLFLIFTYLSLVGFPLGALRAYLMTLFLTLSYLLKFKYSSLKGLILSSIIVLLFNPYSIYSVSFLLSYGCVLGIILFFKIIRGYLGDGYVSNSLSLSLSIGIVIFPISIYFFRIYPLETFISNLLLIPFYSLAIVLSYIALLFNFLGFLIFPTLNLILNISDYIVKILNLLSIYSRDFIQVSIASIIIYYGIILIVYFKDKLLYFYRLLKVVMVYGVFAILFSIFLIYSSFQNFKVDYLYVGQGDCSIMTYKGKSYMVDTGGSYRGDFRPGEYYTLNYLEAVGVAEIEKLFISHFDEDHIDGLLDLLDRIRFKAVYVSYIEDNIYLRELAKRNIPIYKVEKNDVLDIDGNTTIEILSNPKKLMDSNDKSMVMKVEHRGFNILYTGDISSRIEESLKVGADLLKVSHHGSSTATSESFIKDLKPKYAVISAGIDNPYAHPTPEVLNILNKNGVQTKTTSIDGQISLVIDNKGRIKFKSFKEEEGKNVFMLSGVFEFIIIYLYIKKWSKYEVQRTI